MNEKKTAPRKEKKTENVRKKAVMIYVGNLRYTRDEKGIKFLFSKYGKVKSVKVITERGTGKSKGIAFVEMLTEKSAREAIQKLNGAQVDGRTLKVSEALPQEEGTKKSFTNNRYGFKRRMIIRNKKKGLK